MLNELKAYFKRYPLLVSAYRAIHIQDWVDIYDLYFPARGGRSVVTPYGFKLRVGRSAAHLDMQTGGFESDE
jgi:hypothetical protein